MNEVTIIFDADDTLWETQPLYEQAKNEFFDQMEKLGFDRELVIERFRQVDLENVSKMGLSKTRFPTSMLLVYELLCKRFDLEIHPEIETQLNMIGTSVFQTLPTIIEGTISTLRRLKEQGYRLVLYTAGDPEVQLEKIQGNRVQHFFDALYIVDSHLTLDCTDCDLLDKLHINRHKKNEEALRKILSEQKLASETTWMVGNSIRSDINPAVHLGLRAIWVKGSCWEYDIEEMSEGRVWEVDTLREVPSVISREMSLLHSNRSEKQPT